VCCHERIFIRNPAYNILFDNGIPVYLLFVSRSLFSPTEIAVQDFTPNTRHFTSIDVVFNEYNQYKSDVDLKVFKRAYGKAIRADDSIGTTINRKVYITGDATISAYKVSDACAMMNYLLSDNIRPSVCQVILFHLDLSRLFFVLFMELFVVRFFFLCNISIDYYIAL
jgi:hypothetical protein